MFFLRSFLREAVCMGRRVLVAMSGGGDSSVAAWLLQRQGYDCAGVTMKLLRDDWMDASAPDGRVSPDGAAPVGDISVGSAPVESAPVHTGAARHPCCSLDDVEDARAVARRLGIPFYVWNFQDRFEKTVIRQFANAYAKGDTPNPCIVCNRRLKFGTLLRRARLLGFDYIATGHYARICLTPSTGRWAVRKGREAERDQSYVLASMNQLQLRRTLFPLGDFSKADVRRIAEEQGFLNARKHDSQDICFVPDGDYGAFLERYTGKPCLPGDILDLEGRVIGRHRGAVRYTLGQRKGLGVSAPEPLYVCGKSMEDNTVTLGPSAALFHRALIADDWVWSAVLPPTEPIRVRAKIRYRQTEQDAVAEPLPERRWRIVFDEPQRAITPGQAVALYRGDMILGGGRILCGDPEDELYIPARQVHLHGVSSPPSRPFRSTVTEFQVHYFEAVLSTSVPSERSGSES